MACPVEANGAKLYREIRRGRVAWYKVIARGFEVGKKRSPGAQVTYYTVLNEADAIAAVNAWVEGDRY